MRDATYVRHEALDNETELSILEHTTDTAGSTEIVFALFDLQFSPRIRDMSDQLLYCKRPLVVRRYLGIKPARMGWPSLAKNPLRIAAVKPLVSPCPESGSGGGRYLSFSAGRAGRLRRFPAVGHKFLDPAVRVRAHTAQNIT